MYRSNLTVTGLAALLTLAVGCSRHSATPTSPSGAVASGGQTNAEGDPTLKVTAPTLISPINDVRLQEAPPLLTAAAVTGKYASVSPQYRFFVFSAAGALVEEAVADGPSYQMLKGLDFNTRYTWRVRAEFDGAFGPWSSTESFLTPEGGYVRGNELYDPLYNGKTIGRAFDTTFIPGVGIQLNGRDSYVEYQLPATLTDGELSAMMTNIGNGSEPWKTKVLSMLQGDGVDTTLNRFRVTIDKRTTWLGQGSRIRYTMRSRGVDAGEPAGGSQTWSRAQTYYWLFEWRGGESRLRVFEGGRNGNLKENLSVRYRAPYSPNPHLIRLGSVGGRVENETNPGTVIWNVWVSPNPRPVLPNDR